MAQWTVKAEYDPEARIWWTAETDIPGLATSGETLQRLQERIAAILPEVIELNAHEIDPERLAAPHSLRVVAHYEEIIQIST